MTQPVLAPWAVGIDIGGTNIRAAEIRSDGSVGHVVSEAVDRTVGTVPFAQVVRVVGQVLAAVVDPPIGIGVGVTGPVDPATGVIDNPHTLPPALQGNVQKELERAFGLPVAVENDANVAVLAEAKFGAGRRAQVVVCVTVGTGVGVGVVVRGRLHSGASGTHPEAGHLVVDPAGPLCYCGAHGCIESWASARAVLAAGLAAGVVAAGGSAQDVHEAARRPSPAATAIVAGAHRALALGVRNLVAAYAADTVILTGNALGDTVRLIKLIQAEVQAYAFPPEGGVAVSVSVLGGHAGCIGAATLVLAP